jgi:integrase/recombinase XerD
MTSSQVYLHPDKVRLRDAVERVPSPRELPGAAR